MKASLLKFVQTLRRLTRDDAYERYQQHYQQQHQQPCQQHCHEHHVDQPLLSRREFYMAETQRKWSGVKRCC